MFETDGLFFCTHGFDGVFFGSRCDKTEPFRIVSAASQFGKYDGEKAGAGLMTKKLLNKKIVILDACTVSNGDVDFSMFESLGDVKIYDVLEGDELADACREAEVLLVNKTKIDEKLISACPNLELICLFATGYDNVDTEAAKRRGIPVCNVPRYSTESVTQHVFAMLLEFARSVSGFEKFVKDGGWTREGGKSVFAFPIENLAGKTFGILGFGSIGSSVGYAAAAFGMKVLYHSATRKKNLGRDFRYADLDTLFKRSDFLSLHCPLNEETREIVNSRTLGLMKPQAVLINTARGGLVDQNALADALNNGRLRAALLDVVSDEPIKEDNILLGAKNCFITPHVAWAAAETRQDVVYDAAVNVGAFYDGYPDNVVNGVPGREEFRKKI